ncbi:OmpA family protein [Amphibiibacter pelophylacis]|uniref:OmpA family protein n=1 Tax=Amphibiibacter pelophylacis TaxID=1799477 RepID=A0ACC6P2N5_9BURK
MRTQVTAIVLASSLMLSACANMTEGQQTTGKGAGLGALAGAVIGAATGDRTTALKGAAIGAGLGALGGYVWSQRLEEQKRQMEAATKGTGIQVDRTADNRLKLNVPADAGFAVGSAQISSTLANVLNQFATGLVGNPAASVAIIGHTDNTGSDAINNPLSLNRAAAARDYLVSRGVASNRFAIEGRGSREPVASNASNEGRAQNRRVEIYVSEAAPR